MVNGDGGEEMRYQQNLLSGPKRTLRSFLTMSDIYTYIHTEFSG